MVTKYIKLEYFVGILGIFVFLNWNFFKAHFWPQIAITPLPQETAQVQALSTVKTNLPPNTLYIPGLNIKAPVIYTNNVSETEFQKHLQKGVVHYPGTALPGELGNVYIFGHSSDYLWTKGDYKTVFRKLPGINLKEKIKLSDSNGKVYTYTVVRKEIVSPKNLTVLKQDRNVKILTLQTSYPLGTSLMRYLDIARKEE